MNNRLTVDTINSDQLDELYDDRDRLQAQLSDMTRDRDRWKWYRDDAERRVRVQRARAEAAEATVTCVRELRDRWLLMTLEPGQVRRLLDGITTALAEDHKEKTDG